MANINTISRTIQCTSQKYQDSYHRNRLVEAQEKQGNKAGTNKVFMATMKNLESLETIVTIK